MGRPLNTPSGACTGSSGEEWGFLGFSCGPLVAVDQKVPSLAGVRLARVTSWSLPPPALLRPCQLALQVELQVAPPLPMEGGPGQAGRQAHPGLSTLPDRSNRAGGKSRLLWVV